MTCLGFKLDPLAFEAGLPLDKLTKCQALIGETPTKKQVILKQLQQITGLLNYACNVTIPCRAFLRRLTNISVGLTQPCHHVGISSEARKDLTH